MEKRVPTYSSERGCRPVQLPRRLATSRRLRSAAPTRRPPVAAPSRNAPGPPVRSPAVSDFRRWRWPAWRRRRPEVRRWKTFRRHWARGRRRAALRSFTTTADAPVRNWRVMRADTATTGLQFDRSTAYERSLRSQCKGGGRFGMGGAKPESLGTGVSSGVQGRSPGMESGDEVPKAEFFLK